MRLDIARRQAAGIEREDLLVEPLEPTLALADDLRLKRARPIAGRVDPNLAVLGDQRLRRRPVPRVAGAAGRFLVGLIAEVVGQLDLHRPLHQPLGQLGEQTARTGDLLLGPGASEQLIDHLVGQQRLDLLGELGRGSGSARSASASLRSPSGLAARHAGAITGIRVSSNLVGIVLDMSLLSTHAYTEGRTLPGQLATKHGPALLAALVRSGPHEYLALRADSKFVACAPDIAQQIVAVPLYTDAKAAKRSIRASESVGADNKHELVAIRGLDTGCANEAPWPAELVRSAWRQPPTGPAFMPRRASWSFAPAHLLRADLACVWPQSTPRPVAPTPETRLPRKARPGDTGRRCPCCNGCRVGLASAVDSVLARDA